MNLITVIQRLNTAQLKELHQILTESAIAYEFGGNATEIFRRAKHRKVGLMRRVYERLEQCDNKQLEALSKSLGEL